MDVTKICWLTLLVDGGRQLPSVEQTNRSQHFRNPNPLTMHNDPASKIYPCHPYFDTGQCRFKREDRYILGWSTPHISLFPGRQTTRSAEFHTDCWCSILLRHQQTPRQLFQAGVLSVCFLRFHSFLFDIQNPQVLPKNGLRDRKYAITRLSRQQDPPSQQ